MYANKLQAIFLGTAEELYESLPDDEVVDITGGSRILENRRFWISRDKDTQRFDNELKVRRYTISICVEDSIIYFLRGFIKKNLKTPRNEIEMAEKCIQQSLII